MTMITPSYLGETIEYSSLHACRSTLEDPTNRLRVRVGGVHRGPVCAIPSENQEITSMDVRVVRRNPRAWASSWASTQEEPSLLAQYVGKDRREGGSLLRLRPASAATSLGATH